MMSSSSRDRTLEFRNTVQSLRGRQMNGGVTSRRSQARQNSEFINIAKSISQDITNTYTKLEKLTLLCKRKTIFDDKPVEIQELTYIIKHDIANLNKQIGQLQNIAKWVMITQNWNWWPSWTIYEQVEIISYFLLQGPENCSGPAPAVPLLRCGGPATSQAGFNVKQFQTSSGSEDGKFKISEKSCWTVQCWWSDNFSTTISDTGTKEMMIYFVQIKITPTISPVIIMNLSGFGG